MKKSKLILIQVMIAIILISTSVYATLNTTIELTQSSTKVSRGNKVTVKMSLKDVEQNKKVISVSGYINYNKDIFKEITVNNIQKDSNNQVTIGEEKLPVEDLTNASIDNMPDTNYFVAFNGNPTSGNDAKLVIDFKSGMTSDVDLVSIDFYAKDDAELGEVKNAITYSMFVVSSSSDQSAEITKSVDITVEEASSEPETPTEKTLSSIAITKSPTKTSYKAGENFDTTGMVVTATYSDGSTKEVTNYTVTPSGKLSASDTKVTISYKEGDVTKTAAQTITVKAADDTSEKTLSSITITRAPTKTSYEVGEKFDKTGMVITAKYSDGTTKEVTNYTVNPSGALSKNDTKVTITYKEGSVTKTITQAITVKAASGGASDNASGGADGSKAGSGSGSGSGTSAGTTNGKDTTQSSSSLPYTGAKLVIIPAIVLAIVAYISYRKYKNYKDI